MATFHADLAKRGDVGTHYKASGQQRFHHWKAKTFNDRRRQEKFAVSIAPLKLRIANSAKNGYLSFKTRTPNLRLNPMRLRSGDSDDHELGLEGNRSCVQRLFEDPHGKRDVFVTSMLRNAQQKWLPLKKWLRSVHAIRGGRFDRIQNCDRFVCEVVTQPVSELLSRTL